MLSIRTVTHPLNLFMAYANSRLQPYQEVVWVIGDGRSGTNWLSQTINHDRRSRFIYEPFHPGKIASMKDIRMFQYIRPEADDPSFHETAGAVLRGACYNPRVTYANRPRFYRRLLIKDIFAHLFAKWASLRFPNTKIVLLMRHPFAVALSKLQRKSWSWMTEPREFFKQPQLMNDHLDPFRKTILDAETDFEKLIVIWSAIHYVWYRQFANGQFHAVLYENLCRLPRDETVMLARYMGRSEREADAMCRAASATCKSVFPTNHAINVWDGAISEQQITKGLNILSEFGMDRFYGVEPEPRCGNAKLFNY